MRLLVLTAILFALPLSASAQDYQTELRRLEELKLDEAQVQSLFSLLFSQAPYLMNDSADSEQMIRELAPQALQILRPDQRRFLEELAPREQLNRFGNMNRDERKRFMFDAARGLVHPSKQEWLERMEEMTSSD